MSKSQLPIPENTSRKKQKLKLKVKDMVIDKVKSELLF